MVPLWFTLSALCFVGAAVLLYVDIDRRRGRGRRRRSWARSHGFDYEQESTEILKRWGSPILRQRRKSLYSPCLVRHLITIELSIGS